MAAFETFCERYLSHFTYNGSALRRLGVEKEILVTDEDGWMADVTRQLWPYFKENNFEPFYDDFYKDEILGFNFDNTIITTDAGRGTIEVVLEPLQTIQESEKNMYKALRLILEAKAHYLQRTSKDLHILGLGYQPLQKPARENWNKKQRYDVLLDYFEEKVYSSAISAADQVHVDISIDEFVPVTNVLNALAGFMIVLFSNSPVMYGEKSKMHSYREMFWDGLGLERTGLPKAPLTSPEEYLHTLWNLTCIMDRKGDKFYTPHKKFIDLVDGTSDDNIFDTFCIHESSVWFCARPRVFGTIETRPTDLQPWGAMMTVPAFGVGIVENWQEAQAFTKDFEWIFFRELRRRASKEGFDLKIEGRPITFFLKELLDIARKGLRNRGKGEEIYLEPLYQRVEEQKTSSEKFYEIFERDGIKGLLESASLKSEYLKNL